MLNEIQSESLQNLLTFVSRETTQAITLIPGVDGRFPSGLSNSPASPESFPLHNGDVIEIQGPASSGKTHLIYYVTISCILPAVHASTGAALHGWNKAAVIFDCDNSFDIHRLYQLVIGRLKHMLPHGIQEAEQLANEALSRVHVFRPASSAQLAATLLHLPVYHSTQIPDNEIGLVAIDAISAFYWPDRFVTEQLRSAGKEGVVNPLHHVWAALERLRLSHGPVIFLANWALISPSKDSVSLTLAPAYKQHLHPHSLPNLSSLADGNPTTLASPLNTHVQSSAATFQPYNARMESSAPGTQPKLPPLTYHITLSAKLMDHSEAYASTAPVEPEEGGRRENSSNHATVVGWVRSNRSTLASVVEVRIGLQDVVMRSLSHTGGST